MYTTEETLALLKKHESELRDRFGLESLVLYGSYAKNTQTIESDIDLLYELRPGYRMPFMRVVNLETYIESLLDVPKVEVVQKKNINPIVYQSLQSYAIAVF